MEQKQGRLKPDEAQELLETLAFQQAAETAVRGTQHSSRLARFKTGSWQVDVICKAKDTITASTPEELRIAIGNPAAAVIFLPQSAMITAEIIERICTESALEKFIVWENG